MISRDPNVNNCLNHKTNFKVIALLENIKSRIKPDELLNFLGFTGANVDGTLGIAGEISEEDIIAALNLVTEKYGLRSPYQTVGLAIAIYYTYHSFYQRCGC